MDNISMYIKSQWDATIRFNPQDNGTLLGLPYPYIVPCIKDRFQELFYWDTYFACRGLAIHERKEDVKNNLLNFFHELNRFGFIPNGSRTYFLNRSQPPFLGALIKLTLNLFPDDIELKKQSYHALTKEVAFRDKHRRDSATGLYFYGSNHSEDELKEYYQLAVVRHGADPDEKDNAKRKEMALTTLAEAESGWDFSARFNNNCHNCAAVDLNSLMYLNFEMLSELAVFTGGNGDIWKNRQHELSQAMRKYNLNADGIFVDYDLQLKSQMSLITAASFFPLWVSMATPQEAYSTRNICCRKLEYPFGISATEKFDTALHLQWEYPNGWPCLQMISFEALDRYDFKNDARRIAEKYCKTVQINFEKNNNLWEKYNVTDGSTRVASEYEMPAMMGWSAGTYLVAAELLKQNN